MTVTFAPCPTYAGYEASPCGVIRRAARPSTAKNGPAVGTIVPAKVMTLIAARRNYVGLSKPHGWTRIADMVADAWPDLPEDDDTYDAFQPDLNRCPGLSLVVVCLRLPNGSRSYARTHNEGYSAQ